MGSLFLIIARPQMFLYLFKKLLSEAIYSSEKHIWHN